MMDGEVVKVVSGSGAKVSTGSCGLKTQVHGAAATVSSVSAATGGIGHIIDKDAK